MGRGQDLLCRIEKLFCQLLSSTKAGELNLHFILCFAGQAGQALGQVNDLNRRAHIQDQNVPMAPDGKGPQHQGDSFLGRHEKTLDLRVSNSEWKPLAELLLENRDDTAARS